MTIIASIIEDGFIYMGGDSGQFFGGGSVNSISEEKVFQREDILFGSCGAARLSQILRYNFDIPEKEEEYTDTEYIYKQIIPEMQVCFEENGFLERQTDVSFMDGDGILLGYGNKVYYVASDFGATSTTDKISTMGAAQDIAIGALAALESLFTSPERRLLAAMEICAQYNAFIRGPFYVKKMEIKQA